MLVPLSSFSNLSAIESSVSLTGHQIYSIWRVQSNSYLILFCILLNKSHSSSSHKCLIATCSNRRLVILFFYSLFLAAANIRSIGLNIGVYCGIVKASSFLFSKNSLIQSYLWILALSNKNTNFFLIDFHWSS